MPEMRSVLNAPLTRNIVRGLIIVARDQPDLWRALTHEFGQSQEIRVLLDRRQGERRKDNQAHTPDRRGADRRQGRLAQVGWSRQPLLDCNLENVNFYRLRAFQRFRVKRWDYYAVFTPRRFFSATIADLGYAGNIFVYTLDFTTGELHEEGLVIPFGKGIRLERNPEAGEAFFSNKNVSLHFIADQCERRIDVRWPAFHKGRGIQAEIVLYTLPRHESMNIVIPIGAKRFYDNTKINSMPARGFIQYGEMREELQPDTCIGSLDWGRGVWEYQRQTMRRIARAAIAR